LARVRVRPEAVAPNLTYGASVVETTTGSDYPPLAQLTVDGTLTAVLTEGEVT